MDLGLRGKVAIVLGASRGIGRACAEALGKEGCLPCLAAREMGGLSEAALALERECRVEVFHRSCDVTAEKEPPEFTRAVLRRFGRIDILVNNCDGPKVGSLRDVAPRDWTEAIDRSLLQVVRWTQAVLPHMKDGGRIVNIVSTSVRQSIDGRLLSNTIRPGVIGFSKSIAREFAARGITINSVLPGRIRTERTVRLAKAQAEEEGRPFEEVERERWRDIPAGRLGKPEEVGALVAFLCSAQAGFITGSTVTIDGGMTRAIL